MLPVEHAACVFSEQAGSPLYVDCYQAMEQASKMGPSTQVRL